MLALFSLFLLLNPVWKFTQHLRAGKLPNWSVFFCLIFADFSFADVYIHGKLQNWILIGFLPLDKSKHWWENVIRTRNVSNKKIEEIFVT